MTFLHFSERSSTLSKSKTTLWRSWKEYRDQETWIETLPRGGDLPWALFYPADYSIGSSNLGMHYVYRCLKEMGVAVERFFETPVPYRSVEDDTLLERFDVITAGVSYEDGAVSFFKWLNGGGIPLSPLDREATGAPVVGAGGAISYINPLLLSGVCDFIVLGDALDSLDYIAACLRGYMDGGDRHELWKKFSEHGSILVPPVDIVGGHVAKKKFPERKMALDDRHPMHSVWTTPNSAFGDTLLIELQRGCARNCRYCTLPGSFGRMRFRPFEMLKGSMDEILARTNVKQVGLVTPEASDYPELPKLLDYLEEKDKEISFASLRIDRLTEKMISCVKRGGRHSITVAPETGSDELRRTCGKDFTNEDVVSKLATAASMGIDQVKLYFMVGLPNETDEDVENIAALCRKIIDSTGQNLILSVTPFVPKPGTPWEREEFSGTFEIRRKYGVLSAGIRKIKKKTPQLRLTSPKEAENEFDLAWYSYNDSSRLAASIEKKQGGVKKCHSHREETLVELKSLFG
ncbi:MAG: radical SAM protein [Synergistaceae bacterium]|nr:radical SAM protein [Synergistaceae bacterium]